MELSPAKKSYAGVSKGLEKRHWQRIWSAESIQAEVERIRTQGPRGSLKHANQSDSRMVPNSSSNLSKKQNLFFPFCISDEGEGHHPGGPGVRGHEGDGAGGEEGPCSGQCHPLG